MFRSSLIFFGLLLTFCVHAQRLNHVQGEVIIQLKSEVSNPSLILRNYATYRGRSTKVQTKKCLSGTMNIWQLKFDFATIHEGKFLADLRKDKSVLTAQFNHLLSPRNTPNDPEFNLQWHYINSANDVADLDADLAWDITTGGVTVNGDTIVVVALDDGVDLNHEDWGNNLWKNHAEIPDNGIDDDENGYIDDVDGWNPITNTDAVGSRAEHGTPVMGIMGAKGNNGIGVTGVNWDVKVMMVKTDFNADEATLIAGYGYPLALRKMYNETNGEKGAFIVATNASWGTDNGMPEDAPIWCALYDSLGTVGILNCGATANENINVDEVGDLPTTCPSDYLIGVTNVNRTGLKENQAGFGAINIDLGAFGEDTYTLKKNNRYAEFGGTSGATPHVTGAIGLLYAAPCNTFGDLVKNSPAAAALLARKYILDGVKSNESLEGITVTGGQLNLNNSIQLLMQECGTCILPLGVEVSELIDVSATINWASSSEATASTLRFRPKGTTNWTTINNAVAPYTLTGLTACTEYEYELKSDCGEETSGFTRTFIFKTDGCCMAPENIRVTATTNQSIRIEWDSLFAAQRYEVSFSEVGDDLIDIIPTTTNFVEIGNLNSCTVYTFAVRTICENMTTTYSPAQSVTTNGCGACTDVAYCESTADGDFEWISLVKLNTLNHESGSEDGYGDYTGLSTDLNTLEEYELTLNMAYNGFPFDENVQAWIDYNHDGIFDPETENIINLEEDVINEYTGKFTVPIDATPGLTRMRIAIKWRGAVNDTAKPGPCDTYDFGEVEDYCVNIIQTIAPCFVPNELTLAGAPTLNEANITWVAQLGALNYQYRYRLQGTEDWVEATTDNKTSISLSNLESCTSYELQAQSLCDSMMTSGYSEIFRFNTACECVAPTNVRQVDTLDNAIKIAWDATEKADKYEVNIKKISTQSTIRQVVTSNETVATSLDKCSAYEVSVRAFCLETDGVFSEIITATTGCEVAVTDVPVGVESLRVYPNPFKEKLSVEIDILEATNLSLKLYDSTGKLFENRTINKAILGRSTFNFDLQDIPPGIYLLGIETEKGKTVRRVVKF